MNQPRVVQAKVASALQAAYFANTDKMRLFKSTFTPTPNSTLADFNANRVPATDIADVTMTGAWIAGVSIEGAALLIYNSLVVFFPAGTAVYPILAGGYYIVDTGGTQLLEAASFDTPVSFLTNADTLLVKPIMSMPVDGDSDAEFVSGP